MTHLLELEPEIERALETKARRQGLDVSGFLLELARREAMASDTEVEADKLWARMTAGGASHNAAIIALAQAPEAVQAIVMQRSGEAATRFYASPEGQAEWEELADWRALDGEDFHGFEADDAEAEREAA